MVAALVLAAAFVVLALVVNSAIFTENLATRADVAGSDEALGYRAEVVDSVEETVVDGNADAALGTQSALESYTEREVVSLRKRSGFRQAIRGGVVDIEYLGLTMGERIAQDNRSRNLTSRNAAVDWRLADDVNRLRNVQFEFTEIDTDGPLTDEPFRMVLDDNGDIWRLSVSSEGGILGAIGANEVEVVVETPSDSAQCVRDEPAAGDPLTVDVTGGTVAGEPCHALTRLSDGTQMWLGTGLGSGFDIEFENSDGVNGSYSMVYESGTSNPTALNAGHDPDEPYVADALYDVEVSYAYQSHSVAYETDIRVAPGEVPP
jgi:hypothetical protein